MKKINKVIMGLAAVTMLGGCAKTVTAEEAAKIADGLSFSNLNITEGKMKTTIDKLSGNGEQAEAALALLTLAGIKEGKSEETSISSAAYSTYFISGDAIREYGDDGYIYSANGNAITIEAKEVKAESPTDTGTATASGKTAYRADGLMDSANATVTVTFAQNDVLTMTTSLSFTWTLA